PYVLLASAAMATRFDHRPVTSTGTRLPAVSATMPEESPMTATGTALSSVESLPSSPTSLSPQQRTAPVDKRAQVWLSPVAIATTADERPVTPTGTALSVVAPLPSWPASGERDHSRGEADDIDGLVAGGRRAVPQLAERIP